MRGTATKMFGLFAAVLFTATRINGQVFVSDTDFQTLSVANVDLIEQISLIGNFEDLNDLEFLPNSEQILFSGYEALRLWDFWEDNIIWEFPVHASGEVAFSTDGRYFVADVDYGLYRWELSELNETLELTNPSMGRTGGIHDLTFSSDGSEIVATRELSGGVYRWQSNTGEFLTGSNFAYAEGNHAISSALSKDGTFVFMARSGGYIEIREALQGELLSSINLNTMFNVNRDHPFFPGHSLLLDVSSDYQTLVSVDIVDDLGNSNFVTRYYVFWFDIDGTVINSIQHDNGLIWTGTFSPDGQLIALGNRRNGDIYLWDASTGEELVTLTGHSEWVTSLTFNPEGTLLASTSTDGTVRLWGVPAQ